MVNKITNWTFGGFFRALGRFFAFLVIGLLIALICQKNDLKIGQLFGIDYVYAAENVSLNLKKYYVRWYDISTESAAWGSSTDTGTNATIPNNSSYVDALRIRVGSSSKFTSGVKYRIAVVVQAGTAAVYKPIRSTACAGSTSSDWTSNSDLINTCQYITYEKASDNSYATYYFDVVPNTTLYGFQVNFYFQYVYIGNPISIQIKNNVKVSYDRSTQEAIETQTTTIINGITNSTNDLINSIEDDNVDDDSSDMADYLNDLDLDSEGPISGILTLPIDLLQNVFVNNSAYDLCATYKGQRFCLPNGRLIWARDDVSSFKHTFNIWVGGYLFYKMLRSFINTSEKAINPKEDKIEVMKL